MPKTKISEFSSTPGNNTDIDGINIAEGCAPSGINDAIRELMSQLKDFQAGTAGDSFNGPVGTTTAAAGAFTTLSASGAVTLSGGTANGVPYLNGSKVLTTGSALTFDGTNLGVGTTSPGAKLQVEAAAGSGGGDVAIRLRDSTSTNTLQMIRTGATYSYGGMGGNEGALYSANTLTLCADSSGPIKFATNGSEQMRLTSTGLGIGTSSPNYRADILASNFRGLRVQSSGDDAIITMGSQIASSQYWSIAATSNTSGQGSNRFIIETTDANAGGTVTPRLTIDSSGNVGIGTSSPGSRLDVAGAISSVNGYQDNLVLQNALSGSRNRFILGQSLTSGAYIYTDAPGGVAAALPLTFWTAGTERARIDSSGNLLVGTTSGSGQRISVVNSGNECGVSVSNGTNTSFFAHAHAAGNYISGSSANDAIVRGANGVSVAGGNGTNGVRVASGGTSWSALSDERHKDIIEPIANAASKVSMLRAVIGKYKTDEDGVRRSFLIAQDVQQVLPEAVVSENPDALALSYTDLIPFLTAAIKEQQAIIEQLQADVAALKGN